MRTKRQKIEHQGALNKKDQEMSLRFRAFPDRFYTTLDICRITGRVSARDVVRKIQASGIPIGPAVLMRTNENGSRVYGWRMK